MQNAPTTKIQNNIEQGLTISLSNGVNLFAAVLCGYCYESVDPYTGNVQIAYKPDCYIITSHQGLMPAFFTEEYNTLQELANRMKQYADLRNWHIVKQ